ncbi:MULTISPECIES: CaiB/BaiF CoA transferase family protein [Pseudonocardia]|uniref:Formyl-coenzyme A transferase n=2 Tax=Pseudonocardia TaxID=1847 RepID=A0A1Y2MHI4_PSEAH|nr:MULTISPECIES: CaiB/BaiF CoA-transferase family protein [Pseudonocardia]OSY34429.1 Formyl-coenzyme A transferase [Pseudonocardia autotrophica]TDN74686.1 formyl-CoA transferase [Pseudonocardia autotrophica]BBG05459.1 CoA transferase [Pseudonocardia autotrophica]GEC29732.1 CoA transferase [Pseudonocardia saturnea]
MTRTLAAETPPLDGITVVSLEQAVAAPFATRQLADLGARVIKIERPDGGDFARGYDEAVHGNASYFVWLNRGKESLTLDVKSEQGRQILTELLDTADVLVQNLGPGAAGRLGLDPATLAEHHPRVIPCSVTGWGSTGPWANRKAYDLLVQCETGLLSVTGTAEHMAKVGISVADIAAGMYAHSGILTALLRRATTGAVSAVEVSLFEALAEWMSNPVYYAHYSGRTPPRSGARHATIAPYGPFGTADGTILLVVQNDREWRRLCAEVLGGPAIADDTRFATNSARLAHRDELDTLIAIRLSALPTSQAKQLLDDAGIANAGINDVADLATHPVLAGRHRWHEVGIPGATMQALQPPVDLAGVAPVMGDVPALGAHTDTILAELGHGDRIALLRAAHVV